MRPAYSDRVFSPEGPTLRELAVQALSSVDRGYDLLAATFDHTPFRTPDSLLDATTAALAPLGPFDAGLDLCCGTGAGLRVLAPLCRKRLTGVDFSAGMLARARSAAAPAGGPQPWWVRADARALPFDRAFDLVVSFGAFGHFLPAERPGLFAQVHRALRPGGLFAFPIGAPPPATSPWYWAMAGFDGAMRVRNAVRRPPFVMYYRTFPFSAVRDDLAVGFDVALRPLGGRRRRDGSPRVGLVLARKV